MECDESFFFQIIPNVVMADWAYRPRDHSYRYYLITFLGFFDPPPPQRNHVFTTENNQKLAFSDPPCPPTSDYVIYEWALRQSECTL